jgi:hypothetical protein
MSIGRTLTVVIGFIGALIACGGDSTDVPSGDVTVTLLTAADLGSGWREGHEVGEADFQDAWQIPCDDVAMNPTTVEVLRPSAGIQFEPADGSNRHLIEFVTIGAEDDLVTALEAYIGAMGSCPPESTWSGGSLSVTPLELAELGALGDQRSAFTSVATLSGGTDSAVWHVRNAAVRVGSHIISLGLTEILDRDDAQPAITDAEFVEMVRTAVGKFDR